MEDDVCHFRLLEQLAPSINLQIQKAKRRESKDYTFSYRWNIALLHE